MTIAEIWVQQSPADPLPTFSSACVHVPALGLFITGNLGGSIQTSPDGFAWTDHAGTHPVGTAPAAFAVRATPTLLLVMVTGFGNAGSIYTSTDGVAWTAQTPDAGYTDGFSGVVYCAEDDLFVAVKGPLGSGIQTSPDGVTWTDVAAPPAGPFRVMVRDEPSNVLYVAAMSAAPHIYTSPDAAVWTSRTLEGAFAGGLTAGAYSPTLGLFVVGGDGGELQTSPDGINWTKRTTPTPTPSTLYSLHWVDVGGGMFVGTGDSGYLITSPDGIEWTKRDAAGATGDLTSSAANAEYIVVAGENGEVYNSPPVDLGDAPRSGGDWRHREAGAVASSPLLGSAYSPELGRLVAVGHDAQIRTSDDDGITWTARTPDVGVDLFFSAALWSSRLGLFTIVGFSDSTGDGEIQTSPDGITWTSRAVSAGVRPFLGIGESAQLGLLVAVGGATAGAVETSPDGVTWTARTVPATIAAIEDIAVRDIAGSVLLVASGAGSTSSVVTSVDGTTWTGVPVQGKPNLSGIAYAPLLSRFVAVGLSATGIYPRALSSVDGVSWEVSPIGEAFGPFVGVGWSPKAKLFVASGSGGLLATSLDGQLWTPRALGLPTNTADPTMLDVLATPSFFLATGDNLELQTSAIVDVANEGFVGKFKSLLPRGAAWTRMIETVWQDLIEGMMVEPTRVGDRITDILREMDFRQMVELLPDWERIAGLPDSCAEAPVTIGERQQALVARITAQGGDTGGSTVELLTNICIVLGYPDAEIRRFHLPAFTCMSECNDSLYTFKPPGNNDKPGGWNFVYEVILPHTDGNTQAANAVCQVIRSAMAHLSLTFTFPLATVASLTHARASTATMYLPEDQTEIALASDEAGTIYYGHHEEPTP